MSLSRLWTLQSTFARQGPSLPIDSSICWRCIRLLASLAFVPSSSSSPLALVPSAFSPSLPSCAPGQDCRQKGFTQPFCLQSSSLFFSTSSTSSRTRTRPSRGGLDATLNHPLGFLNTQRSADRPRPDQVQILLERIRKSPVCLSAARSLLYASAVSPSSSSVFSVSSLLNATLSITPRPSPPPRISSSAALPSRHFPYLYTLNQELNHQPTATHHSAIKIKPGISKPNNP